MEITNQTPPKSRWTERKMERRLARVFQNQDAVTRVSTFKEAMVMTRDRGLVVRMKDGTAFQITIVEDSRGW